MISINLDPPKGHMDNRGRLKQERQMVGRSSSKFWYCATSMFLLWLFTVVFYFWCLNLDKSQVGLAMNLFVEVHGNNNGNGRHEEGEGHPAGAIENFFTGGDWKKYLEEAEELILLQGAPPEEKASFTQNIASSINQVFGKRLKKLSQNSAPENSSAENGTEKPEGAIHDFGSDLVETCKGKYIYVYDLRSQFNEDYLKHCRSLSRWSNMCPFVANFGLGPQLKNTDRVFSNSGWFETNQFMLEIIFHSRMKQYKCLTNDSSLASAVFVPYYGGLDVMRFLWNSGRFMRDHYSKAMMEWLRERPEWRRMWGRDHFMVTGRITWDFRREGNTDWGNKLMLWPESRNMTMLTIESSPWNNNDFAIPYPTYFHPSNDDQVFQWQRRMRSIKRRNLFSFVGARRPNLATSIRDQIIDQCIAARRKCKLLECIEGSSKCYNPENVMQLFESSTFCLQPPGDSYTRRSTFDSILAGCIPVFFHPGSAYVQYLWHLPRDYTKYSVFIPTKGIKEGKVSIAMTLSRIPRDRILTMREHVINLIPHVVYADPTSTLETLEDAFDITVDGVLERIRGIRKDMESGKNVSDDPDEEITWKKTLFGTTVKHEWDIFFDRKYNYEA